MADISVVVPTYNSATYLGGTIDSILSQEGIEVELIISDHGSTDGTPAILERYSEDPRVRILAADPGGGVARNWNIGSRGATARYIKLVCADDVLHADSLKRQVAVLTAHPECALVATRRRIVRSDGTVMIRSRGLAGMRGVVPAEAALRRMVRAGTNVLGEPACVTFRREALAAAGWWEGSRPYVIDVWTYARVLEHGDLYALGETLASFRVSKSSLTAQLAGVHASQVIAFNDWVADRHPTLIRRWDVGLGAVRAWAYAKARRAIYRRS